MTSVVENDMDELKLVKKYMGSLLETLYAVTEKLEKKAKYNQSWGTIEARNDKKSR
jgi:hypothetical protein